MAEDMAGRQHSILIVGAGVIGLAAAYELARRGENVLVVERNTEVGREASWAAAGLLHQRITAPDAFGWLAREGLARYPALAEELRSITGVDIEFRQEGGLEVALTAQRKRSLDGFVPFHRTRGLSVRWLQPGEVLEQEPHLARDLLGAALYNDDAQVRPPRLLRALAGAVRALGGGILTDAPATALIADTSGRVVGVQTAQGPRHADTTILAAGPWSPALASGLGVSLPVRPVRGQVVLFDAPPATLRHTLHVEGAYLAQRRDGPLLVGATVEEAGFCNVTTPNAVEALRAAAVRACPVLSSARLVRAWAGLRPAPRKRHPYIFSPRPGLWVATGHFRQGILMAPSTARLLADALLLGETPVPLDQFRP